MKCSCCETWMVCLDDFYGYSKEHFGTISHSVDWCPSCGRIVYSGIYCTIKPGHSDTQPSEGYINKVIRDNKEQCYAAYTEWLHSPDTEEV